jgi:MSHA biogenesis protein MshJ
MSQGASFSSLARKFEALNLRERALVSLAVLAVAVVAWDSWLMTPLKGDRIALEAELAAASASGFQAQSADVSDPRQLSLQRAGELQTAMQGLDARIAQTASGFVSSQRMIQVLNDVLAAQGRLELVSIRNLPVVSLVPPAPPEPAGDAALEGAPAEVVVTEETPGPLGPPPYVHAIEIVIDGQYADILEYLEALEALPYRFRWSSLDLSTTGYPRNRVRIELSTLSLDSTWLGV